MTAVPVLTFFNNKGGVGKTSLVYHTAWVLSDLDYTVLTCDLDPQVNLTASFLSEGQLESIWDQDSSSAQTIMQCIEPLVRVSDIVDPTLQQITPNLFLIPGDLALASFEDLLSSSWPGALSESSQFRDFRILTAFSSVIQKSAEQINASIVLIDVGPNLGAINRSALIATDRIVVPLGADIFSLQGLRNLGPTLNKWREGWKKRHDSWQPPEFPLPSGDMSPIGYIVQQHSVRLNRPVKAYDKWVNRMPTEYARNLLGNEEGPYPDSPTKDEDNALTTLKHYRSLVPMAQEARKPIFHLTTADGAFGGHAAAVGDAREDFRRLAIRILNKMGLYVP